MTKSYSQIIDESIKDLERLNKIKSNKKLLKEYLNWADLDDLNFQISYNNQMISWAYQQLEIEYGGIV